MDATGICMAASSTLLSKPVGSRSKGDESTTWSLLLAPAPPAEPRGSRPARPARPCRPALGTVEVVTADPLLECFPGFAPRPANLSCGTPAAAAPVCGLHAGTGGSGDDKTDSLLTPMETVNDTPRRRPMFGLCDRPVLRQTGSGLRSRSYFAGRRWSSIEEQSGDVDCVEDGESCMATTTAGSSRSHSHMSSWSSDVSGLGHQQGPSSGGSLAGAAGAALRRVKHREQLLQLNLDATPGVSLAHFHSAGLFLKPLASEAGSRAHSASPFLATKHVPRRLSYNMGR